MVAETILQSEILTKFVYPFLLIFFIVFAVLEKTKVLGDDQKQLNALVAFVIGLIFVGAVFPKLVVANMILFLTVALIVVFVVLLLWGFVSSGDKGLELSKGLKTFLFIVLGIAVVIAVFWATGVGGGFFDLLFSSNWSNAFWTNFLFIVVIAAALALVLRSSK
ncbi:hypothetical protein KAI04_01795 [Candidatus Pacearchaeota archaeon]|nr:hypothetical protein [Candidatus Pacearchaeota archaeon]